MSDLDKEIRELSDRVQHTRYQFLKIELQTCLTALEMAQFELSIGNATVVQREIAAVEKGVSVIQRFLSALPQDQRQEVDTNLAELNAILESVKAASMHTRGDDAFVENRVQVHRPFWSLCRSALGLFFANDYEGGNIEASREPIMSTRRTRSHRNLPA